jgi:hypothetical protein
MCGYFFFRVKILLFTVELHLYWFPFSCFVFLCSTRIPDFRIYVVPAYKTVQRASFFFDFGFGL